jgi:hypothetical protein
MLLKTIVIFFTSISLAGARRFMHLARAAMSTTPAACHKGVAAPPGAGSTVRKEQSSNG